MTLKNRIKRKTDNVFIQIIRYLLGRYSYYLEFWTAVFMTEFWVLLPLSAVISFSVGLLITYLFSVTWIFNQRRISNRWIELLVLVL